MNPFPVGTALYVASPLNTNVHVALISGLGYARLALQITGTVTDSTVGLYAQGCIISKAATGDIFVNTAADGLAPVWADPSGTTQAKISLTTAQIKALNGTPITLVPAMGAGFAILPISVVGRLNFLTAAYATNTQLNVGFSAASDPLFTNTTLLPVTAGAPIQPFFPLAQAAVTGNDNEYISNAPLQISVPGGNPITGAGTLDVYITYQVIAL